MEKLMTKLDTLLQMSILYLPKALMAIATLIIGLWFIKIVMRGIKKTFNAREFEPTMQRFLLSLIDVLMKIMLLLSVASMLGIETTSFLAILTSAGLAVGLALQGGLSNFAGGILILIFKPFKVGDLIEAQGNLGYVLEISIFTTTLITLDNRTVIIPNGPLSNGNIINISAKGNLRVDLVVYVAIGQDLDKVKKIIYDALAQVPDILPTPAASVNVLALEKDVTKLAVRPYAEPDKYWDVYFQSNEVIRKALDAAKIDTLEPTKVIMVEQ